MNINGHCPITGRYLSEGRKDYRVEYVKDKTTSRCYKVIFDRVGRCLLIDAENPGNAPLIIRPVELFSGNRFIELEVS